MPTFQFFVEFVPNSAYPVTVWQTKVGSASDIRAIPTYKLVKELYVEEDEPLFRFDKEDTYVILVALARSKEELQDWCFQADEQKPSTRA